MADRKRSASRAGEQNGDWLRRERSPRTKRWALEEQLLGPAEPEDANGEFLAALVDRLAEEEATLERLEVEVAGRAQRVAELAQQLERIAARRPHASASRGEDRPTIDPRPTQDEVERAVSLRRCEGFAVDSPSGRIGVVEGVRFGSSVDRPDVLEVKVGRVRQRLIVVGVDQIERILLDEERIELCSDPVSERHMLGELLERLRTAVGYR
jgi:hypothetical protein